MAQVKGFAHGAVNEYVPKADDNRDDPKPAKVFFRGPTERRKRELEREYLRGFEKCETDHEKAALIYDYACSVCEEFVDRVEDYFSTSGAQIKTGKDMGEHGSSALLVEVHHAILGHVRDEVDTVKKLGGSSPSDTQDLDGSVPSVGSTD